MAGHLTANPYRGMDDDKLVVFARCHDVVARLAFTVLIESHRARLYRRCHARLGNRHDAEDALQETLLRAYRGLAGFRSEASIGTWLTAIADNQCNSLAERRARRLFGEHLCRLIELHEQQRQWRHEADDTVTRRVHRALARVPDRDREILLLRFFRDLALEEIARTLNIGLSAAKMRLYRAMARLEPLLDDHATARTA